MRLVRRRRPKVKKLQKAGDLAGLEKALAFEDRYVGSDGGVWDLGASTRAEAAKAIGDLDDPAASEVLMGALDDPHPDVRLVVLEAIAAVDTPVDPSPLVTRLVSWREPGDEAVVERAVEVLTSGKVERLPELFLRDALVADGEPGEREREILNELLAKDPRGQAAQADVARSLAGLLDESGADEEVARAERMILWLGPAAGDAVVQALDEGAKQGGLVRAAGVIGDARALDPVVALLEDDDVELRRAAAEALSGLHDTRAVPALIRATQDAEHSVRQAASEALNGLGLAAVIVGVSTIVDATIREQLEAASAASGPPGQLTRGAEAGTDPVAEAVGEQLAHPPTWAQEVLTRIRKRRQ